MAGTAGARACLARRLSLPPGTRRGTRHARYALLLVCLLCGAARASDPASPSVPLTIFERAPALSRAGEEDGFLTVLEVLRMQTPADLAVVSACETATGRLEGGEGIVGLTRAFMYAGTPRVLCSLWKVDDEATSALMIKFYELWNPKEGAGLGAAQALQQAQAFVRSQEKWTHPYYWAAWVLWGLPD